MTKTDKNLLVKQAMKLYAHGISVDKARNRLKWLVKHGVEYNDDRMLKALNRYKELSAEWNRLEAEHLKLREKFGMPD